MRRSLEMGSPTPDDAPDRPRSSFALAVSAGRAHCCRIPAAGFAPVVTQRVPRGSSRSAGTKRVRCASADGRPPASALPNAPARARRPAPRHRADRRPPARRPMGIMEGVEAAPARRPRPGGAAGRRRRRRRGGGGGGGGGAENLAPTSARSAALGSQQSFARPRRRSTRDGEPQCHAPEGQEGGRGDAQRRRRRRGPARQHGRRLVRPPGVPRAPRGRGRAPPEAGFFAARRRRGGDGDVHQRELHGRRPHARDLLREARGAAPEDAAQIQPPERAAVAGR